VCSYAVLALGAAVTLDDVRSAMAAAGAARFKRPERLEIVPELPVTKVGKIDKKTLRSDAAERLARGWPAGPTECCPTSIRRRHPR
jgi:salicylate---CoA ligase